MSNVKAIFARELRNYFNSPIAYIYTGVFLVFTGWFFFKGFFLAGQAEMRLFFELLPWVYLFLVPAMAMRLWSEERKLGTIEVLMTLPVRDHQAVAGKFLAGLAFLAFGLAMTLPIPLTVAFLGRPDPGPILAGYLGALLVGGAYLAIGLCCSGLTENQIVAFVTGVVACFALFIVGEEFVIISAPAAAAPLLSYFGLGSHYRSILRGVIDSRDLVYYASVIAFFLYANVRTLAGRKL
jgi:ABC-2 type transport system permease protein